MPTGYTARNDEGKEPITLREFATECAKAFLISYREEPWGTPLPRQIAGTRSAAYYKNGITLSELRIAGIEAMTPAEREAEAARWYEKKCEEWSAYRQQQYQARQRYQAMRRQVEAWELPATLAAFKAFLLSQLEESERNDCGGDIPLSEPVTGAQWAEKTIEHERWNIDWMTKSLAAEERAVREGNAWLDDLHGALDALA